MKKYLNKFMLIASILSVMLTAMIFYSYSGGIVWAEEWYKPVLASIAGCVVLWIWAVAAGTVIYILSKVIIILEKKANE